MNSKKITIDEFEKIIKEDLEIYISSYKVQHTYYPPLFPNEMLEAAWLEDFESFSRLSKIQ
jgi:hypothetical protein